MRQGNRTAITLSALVAGCIAAVGIAWALGRVMPSDPNLDVSLVIGGGIAVSVVTTGVLVRIRAPKVKDTPR